MAIPQRRAVYSNGATTDGGAERNASVRRYWPAAPKIPSATSHTQCSRARGTQSGTETIPVMTVIKPTDQTITLVVVSVRVMTRSASTPRAYAVVAMNAARAPSVTRPEADGL